MTGKEALETLGNVEVAVTTIRSGITHFKTLKEQYETEFEVLERELFIRKELKDFDVYQRQLEKLEKENQELKELNEEYFDGNALRTLKINKLQEENAKLKKVIEILKDYFEIWLNYEEEENFGGFEISGYLQINKQEYELLKEVL